MRPDGALQDVPIDHRRSAASDCRVRPAGDLLDISLAWQGIGGSSFDTRLSVNNVADSLYHTSGVTLVGQIGTQARLLGDPRAVVGPVAYRF